ncbi:26S protease regulatory subunit 10B, partial [Eschrichtius robustus]|nr:26S protease regulatory subunit 10B [Eschrichtius robustus]
MAIPGIPYERRLLIMADPRDKALQDYRKKLLEHKEIDGRLKELREQLKELTKQYEKSENDLKALQSVGQIVGEVLKQLTEEKFIVKATNGPRYVVGCRRQLDKSKLKPGTRVALDMTTLTIMRYLPREVDPLVYNMSHEDPGNVSYSEIGGLSEQIRELRELLNQMDGFDTLHRVKMIMATNRPDTLDPALLRPGRLDRKIHIDLPNEQARLDILKIHAGPITKHGEIDYEAIVKLSDGFNGADLRNVCTEAGSASRPYLE